MNKTLFQIVAAGSLIVASSPLHLHAQSSSKTSSAAQMANTVNRQSELTKNPTEIGTVKWNRDLNAAYAQSKSSGKPVFLLFQEVPGCAGCKKFGSEVLSQPLLVEAIEEAFVPVVVFNNRSSGEDKKLLEQFKEPAWNYQVIRFLDSNGKDIVPRRDGIWSVNGVAGRMIQTLTAQKRPVPQYLQTLYASTETSQAQAAFAMYCFWTGEYRLGGIDGVISTEAGWLDGREVTLVRYDQKRLSLNELARKAAEVKCAQKVYTVDGQSLAGLAGGKLDKSYRPASASDQKRQLMRWPEIAKVPGINAMQLTKINSLAPKSKTLAVQWLSPKQKAFLAKQ